MTEYWKSQARKYCEFCKCWLTDNKISVSFHENGKKHKENVQRHIAQLTKQSAKDHRQKEKMDDEIKKMEAAAMAAYLKDVENNADLTSQCINNKLSKEAVDVAPSPSLAPVTAPVWREATSEKGIYYWNTVTNETTWEAPDSYLSIAQQEEKELKKKEKDDKKKEKEAKKKESIKKKKDKDMFKEIYGQVSRAATVEGPAPRAAPFGSWTPVVEVQETIDLQLPKVEKPPPPVIIHDREEIQRERKVESLGDGPVEFKRRKLNKGNMRQRANDD